MPARLGETRDRALLVARAGDQLVVTKLDRLGRSLEHLIELARTLQQRRCGSGWPATSWRPRRWPGQRSVRPSWPRRPRRRRARWPRWRPRPRWCTGGWREGGWRGSAGVIRRVFHGRSPYGLIRYLYGEGRRNEHTEPHLIASWDGDPAALEPAYVEELGAQTVSKLARTLAGPVAGCDRAPERWVYHLVLRNDEADRRLSDEEWAQVCRSAMDATGIAPEGDAAGCRWVAVRHADEHVHVVATLAREDGRPPRVWNDYRALAEVAHEFEDRFGLRSTAGRDDNTAARRPGVKEAVTAERAGRRELPRDVLRQRVKAAAATSCGFAEFTTALAGNGVSVWPRMSERNPGEMTGYAVSLDGWTNGAGEPVRFGGGKLAPDLSLPQLRARWEPAGVGGDPVG